MESQMNQEDKSSWKRLFKCNEFKSVKMHTERGRQIIFSNGEFATDDKELVTYLDGVIASGSMAVRIDPNETHLNPTREDPIASIRKVVTQEARAELLQQLEKLGVQIPKDFGNYSQAPLKAASTRDIAAVSAEGPNEGLAAQLMDLPVMGGSVRK